MIKYLLRELTFFEKFVNKSISIYYFYFVFIIIKKLIKFLIE